MPVDNLLGIHATALTLRANRAQVLASNLANADTPNYKARDIDFREILAQAEGGSQSTSRLNVTHAGHIGGAGRSAISDNNLLYRTPAQPAVDGNTVDSHLEHAAFMENSFRYQASLTFLNGRIRGLLTAIKGE